MPGTPEINTQISSLEGLGSNLNICHPEEFCMITEKKKK